MEWGEEDEELMRASGEVDIQIQNVVNEQNVDGTDSIDGIMSRPSRIGTASKRKTNTKSIGNTDASASNSPIHHGDNFLYEGTGMSKGHTDSLKKIEMKSLSSQLKRMTLLKQEGDKTIQDLKVKLCSSQTDNNRLEKEISSSTSSKRDRNISKQKETDMDHLRAEKKALEKEVAGLQSLIKEAETKSQTRELRLKRALQSVDKFKELMLSREVTSSDSIDKSREEVKDLKQKVASLEKRNSDTLLLFKKQMQLIDVLKRQKIHLEASRMLEFTENEFKESVLDWYK